MKVVENERIMLHRLFVDFDEARCPFCSSAINLEKNNLNYCKNCGNFFDIGCPLQDNKYIVKLLVEYKDENGQYKKGKPTFENETELFNLSESGYEFIFKCMCASCSSSK